MKELYVETISKLYYQIYVDGVPTAADSGTVSVLLKNGDLTLFSGSATAVPGSTGKYFFIVTPAMVGEEAKLQLTWSFAISTQSMSVHQEVDVVTQYCSYDDFAAQNVDYQTFLECERVSRFIINTYCGQSFGKRTSTYICEGTGNVGLRLPQHLLTFTSINYPSYVENRPGDVIGCDQPTTWEVAADGWMLRPAGYESAIDPIYYSKNFFKRNVQYSVTGVWGYNSVPKEVEEASKIITANYLCADHKYRDRYIETLKMADWNITLFADALYGTGDVTADQLLLDYRMSPGVGVI